MKDRVKWMEMANKAKEKDINLVVGESSLMDHYE